MKTAISLPDDVYKQAELLAQRLGTSRSQFYAQALKLYIDKNKSTLVTEKLNEVYKDGDSQLDSSFKSSRNQKMLREDW